MSFIDETHKILDFDAFSGGVCCFCTDSGAVIEGYKKIYELSQTKVTLICEKGNRIDVLGENLTIKELSHKEISIKGTVFSINFS